MTDPDDMSDTELAKLAKEVADRLERRGVVAGGAGIAAGGALGWLASGEARAGSQSVGTIGSQSDPVDLEAEDLNGADLLAASQGQVPQADGNGRLQMGDSGIQSSSDVIITDTQPGTVSDGEFLQNSGGSLTGGTVQTEPNQPPYEEDANSPFSASLSSNSSATFSLNASYDIIKVHGELAGTGSGSTPFKLRPNGYGAASNYTVEEEDGSTSTNDTEIAFATVTGGHSYHFSLKMAGRHDGRWWVDFGLIASDTTNPVSHAFFTGTGLASPITSIEIIAGADPGDVAMNVYGVEVANA